MVSKRRAWILAAHSVTSAGGTLRFDFITFHLASFATLATLCATVSARIGTAGQIYHYRACLLVRKSWRHWGGPATVLGFKDRLISLVAAHLSTESKFGGNKMEESGAMVESDLVRSCRPRSSLQCGPGAAA